MADKWDELCSRIVNAVAANEPEAALVGALTMFAEFGRTMELIGQDIDRLASATEQLVGGELFKPLEEPKP